MTDPSETKGIARSLSHDVVMECLTRSGYLLESRLIQSLSDNGFFVEPNQVILDPRTGKSRELDLIVEYYDWNAEPTPGVCVRTHFPIEAVNNTYPFVLLSRRIWTPNSPTDSYINCFTTPNPNTFETYIGDWYEQKQPSADRLFSQYCGITRKKANAAFMASHPEDIYTSLLKLAEYVADDMRGWESRDIENDNYWRIFFWQPCLVLSGDLLALETAEDGSLSLIDVDYGQLEFNWHSQESPTATIIDIIREGYLLEHLTNIARQDQQTQDTLHEHREKQCPYSRD